MSKKNTILKLIESGEKIIKDEFHPASGGFPFSYVDGPKFTQWMSQIEIFAKRFLTDHPLAEKILSICSDHSRNPSAHENMMAYLRTLSEDTFFWNQPQSIEDMVEDDIERCEEMTRGDIDDEVLKDFYIEITSKYDSLIKDLGKGLYSYFAEQHFYDPDAGSETFIHNLKIIKQKLITYKMTLGKTDKITSSKENKVKSPISVKKVFIVHGHDNEAKISVARFVEQLGLEAIILHEQTNQGKTIIEKFENYSDVGFAIVLYTECDEGKAKKETGFRNRARQNVVFEHGYFVSKIGRDHVVALVKGDVELPGDYSGVVYEPMDDAGAWQFKIAKEMRASGLDVDLNDL